jgi:hypothetical protein
VSPELSALNDWLELDQERSEALRTPNVVVADVVFVVGTLTLVFIGVFA